MILGVQVSIRFLQILSGFSFNLKNIKLSVSNPFHHIFLFFNIIFIYM